MSNAPLGLAEREAQLTATLDARREQRWEQSEVSYERSEIRSARGDRTGALEDAKVALALFPSHIKYLVRASHALYQSGISDEACKLLEQAKETLKSQGDGDKDTTTALAALERRFRPFEHLPTEIIANIFVFVHQDFERLPSPFQLTQVCTRWREIAESTRSLWRDARILRVRDRAVTVDPDFKPFVRKAHRWAQTPCRLEAHLSREDGYMVDRLLMCASLSHNSLNHFELDVYDWTQRYSGFKDVFQAIEPSMETLESIALTHAHRGQRQRFSRLRDSSDGDFNAVSLAFVLRCPRVTDVQLNVGELTHITICRAHWAFSKRRICRNPSFRRLQLDSFGGLTSYEARRARQSFLERSSQLRKLALCNVPHVDMKAFTLADIPFALEVLAKCADTLIELDLSGQANPLIGARAIGVKSFPQLRRLRYVPHDASRRIRPGDMDNVAFPMLESVEAPASLILALVSVPRCIVLRVDSWSKASAECASFAKWLLSLEEDQSPRKLTILDAAEPFKTCAAFLDPIIEALTPCRVGRTACANLEEVRVIHRAAYLFDSTGLCHSLDPAALPELRAGNLISKLVQMEEQRRRVSEDLSPSQKEPDPIASTSASSREASSKRQKLSTAQKAVPRCKALTKIVIEGAQIWADDWAAMKASPCHYEVTPGPDDLPRAGS